MSVRFQIHARTAKTTIATWYINTHPIYEVLSHSIKRTVCGSFMKIRLGTTYQ